MALRLDLEPGQSVKIGENVLITLEHKSGRRAKLRIDSKEKVTLTEAPDDSRNAQTHAYQRRGFT
jgi:hypothetical protein